MTKIHGRILIAADERYQNYARAIYQADPSFVWDFVPAPNADEIGKRSGIAARYDALLLPGGGDLDPSLYGEINTASRNLEPARDAWEWTLLDVFTHVGKPVLGICRGMQSINVYFGGTLYQDIPGHSSIPDGVDGTQDRMHPVRSTGLFAQICGDMCTVNSAHHQATARMGHGLTAEQWAADGVTEGFRHDTLPIWGIQWHPERLVTSPGPSNAYPGLSDAYPGPSNVYPGPDTHEAYPRRPEINPGAELFRAFLTLCR